MSFPMRGAFAAAMLMAGVFPPHVAWAQAAAAEAPLTTDTKPPEWYSARERASKDRRAVYDAQRKLDKDKRLDDHDAVLRDERALDNARHALRQDQMKMFEIDQRLRKSVEGQ